MKHQRATWEARGVSGGENKCNNRGKRDRAIRSDSISARDRVLLRAGRITVTRRSPNPESASTSFEAAQPHLRRVPGEVRPPRQGPVLRSLLAHPFAELDHRLFTIRERGRP